MFGVDPIAKQRRRSRFERIRRIAREQLNGEERVRGLDPTLLPVEFPELLRE